MKLDVLVSPLKRDQDAILDPLLAFNAAKVGASGKTELSFHLKNDAGELIGGANGFTHWNYFFLAHLWVSEKHRGERVGEKIMAGIETEALARGCDHLWLDTFSFQAPGFYEKLGYTRFGRLENYPTGYERYFYSKKLVKTRS